MGLCLVGLFSNPSTPLLHFRAEENLPCLVKNVVVVVLNPVNPLFVHLKQKSKSRSTAVGESINKNKCSSGRISCIPSLLAHQQWKGAGEGTSMQHRVPHFGTKWHRKVISAGRPVQRLLRKRLQLSSRRVRELCSPPGFLLRFTNALAQPPSYRSCRWLGFNNAD